MFFHEANVLSFLFLPTPVSTAEFASVGHTESSYSFHLDATVCYDGIAEKTRDD